MKKRFIVSVDNFTKEQDQLFIKYIEENGLEWWHWLSHTWLLVNPSGNISIEVLRDKVLEIYKSEYNLVVEITVNQDTWAGFGPLTDEKNMFEWLHSNWKKN